MKYVADWGSAITRGFSYMPPEISMKSTLRSTIRFICSMTSESDSAEAASALLTLKLTLKAAKREAGSGYSIPYIAGWKAKTIGEYILLKATLPFRCGEPEMNFIKSKKHFQTHRKLDTSRYWFQKIARAVGF